MDTDDNEVAEVRRQIGIQQQHLETLKKKLIGTQSSASKKQRTDVIEEARAAADQAAREAHEQVGNGMHEG